jgi:hypothetical protein
LRRNQPPGRARRSSEGIHREQPWSKKMTTIARTIQVFVMFLVIATATVVCGAEPLGLEQLVTLVKFLDEGQVIEKIRAHGVAFEAGAAELAELEDAGASDAVLAAVKKAALPKKPAGKLVTYLDVKNMLAAGVAGSKILKLLDDSPTLFTLDAGQEGELRGLGATDAVLAKLQGEGRKPDKAAEITHLAVVLDCSGSMKNSTSDGKAKMEVAKGVVVDLVDKIPDGLGLSFLIYGHDAALKCQAVKVVHSTSDMGPQDKAALHTLIARLRPVGQTPIALALKTAGAELAKQPGGCGLVLISDGKETCQGDPVAETASLAKNLPIEFGAHVIGFDVDQEGQTQLAAVAEEGDGQYYNAANAEELGEAVEKLIPKIQRAVPPTRSVKSFASAIEVSELTLEGFPKIDALYVSPAGKKPGGANTSGGRQNVVQSTNVLGKPMFVEPGVYDIYYAPEEGYEQPLIKGVEVEPQRTVQVYFNRLASAIVVRGLGVKAPVGGVTLYVCPPGTKPGAKTVYGGQKNVVQDADALGKPMLVPGDAAYDVVMRPKGGQYVTIARDLEVERGSLTVVGGSEQ